jgi:limonene-1,2-epoxide hydrolase
VATAQEIVEAFQAALNKKDFTTARQLLHDDVTTTGPLESFQGADSYLDGLKRAAVMIQRIDIKKIFADDSEVCLLYDMVTYTPVGAAFIAEWYQVTDNKISFIRSAYDSLPFVRLLGV